jgi:hypothetical protein
MSMQFCRWSLLSWSGLFLSLTNLLAQPRPNDAGPTLDHLRKLGCEVKREAREPGQPGWKITFGTCQDLDGGLARLRDLTELRAVDL